MIPEDLLNGEGLMVRALEIRAKDSAKREFTGIGVPYGERYMLAPGLFERFEPGAIELDGTKIFWQHREVIGRATAGKDIAAGFEVRAKISDTAQGRDAWTLLEDGAVDSLSIGFTPVDYRTEHDEATGETTIVHTKVRAAEFSLVNFPAYTGAKVSNLRSAAPAPKGTRMDPEELARIARAAADESTTPLAESVAELTRAVALLGDAAAPTVSAVPQFRSIGEFVQAIANGDADALEFHRAMAVGTIDDAIVKDSWVGSYIKLVDERRRVLNTFGRAALPATGMSVEYGKLLSDTTVVAEQVNEGDALAGPGGVKLGVENAPVHTDGGWSELSFQAVQRATIGTLDTLWRAMLIKYAKATEARARAAYYAVMNGHLAADPATNPDAALEIGAAATANEWLDLIIDAGIIYEERGFILTGAHASVDVFKMLNRLTDGDGRRLMNVYGSGVNQVGELNLKTVSGSLANVRVELIGNRATTGKFGFYDPVAIETRENPGAPIRLQDESIINLTKQISLYGYTAVTTPFPEALLPVRIGA